MKLPEVIPPSDLLERVEGIKRGLQKRRRLGRVGWAGLLLASAAQIVVAAVNSPFGKALLDLRWSELYGFVLQWWPYLIPAFVLLLSLLVAGWARFWLKESKAPFRYTCSVAEFRRVAVDTAAADSNWAWLSHDLAERLNQRIGRLRFTDTPGGESHVHLSGSYGVRKDRQDRWVVEVTPRVRIGPPGAPETLAHVVVVPLVAEADGPPPALAALPAPVYDRILERVYFSVATELYKQIQRDVAERIELLPTDYFRAVALFHEAEDYARSNTLDAYEEARQLYARATELLDGSLAPLPAFRPRRIARRVLCSIAAAGKRVRRVAAYVWPRLGSVEVMRARAELGYATMILYRRDLAGQSGQLLNAPFEARPVAERALTRLTCLPRDVADRTRALFDAHVVLALACDFVGAHRDGSRHLAEARRLDPNRTLDDVRYLYAVGLLETQETSKLQTFRRIVELAPRFESAQFSLAGTTEMLWRTRPVLERSVAEIVFDEYDELSKVNPGNIGAWANRGYMRWLLGEVEDLDGAQAAFESGREYKALKRVTFVAELDYGLARIAAERGDFRDAFEHYLAAVPAVLALSHASGLFESYYFERIGQPMFQRFTRYCERVEREWHVWEPFDQPTVAFDEALDAADRGEADRLTELIALVVPRLRNTERAAVSAAIGRHAPIRDARAWAADGLAVLATVLVGAEAPAPVRAAALAALHDPDVKRAVRRVTETVGTARIRAVVLAFVLNDYGNACRAHHETTGDERSLEAAQRAYARCVELNPEYVMPYFNLHTIAWGDWDERRARLIHVVEHAPEWREGQLAYAELDAAMARRAADQARWERDQADQAVAEANQTAGTVRAMEQQASSASEATAAEVARLRAHATRLRAQGANHEDNARREAAMSRDLAQAVVNRLSRLVPHAWLWDVGSDGCPRLRWSALEDRDVRRELVWERECSDLDVRALLTLTTALAMVGTRDDAWRLLQHLRRHFWPDHFTIHERLRDVLFQDIRDAAERPPIVELFANSRHQTLAAKPGTRELLRDAAWVRLAWKNRAALPLLVRPRFLRVMRSRFYRVLVDRVDPEMVAGASPAAVRTVLRSAATTHAAALLRGPDYDALLKRRRYRELALREPLSGREQLALRAIVRRRGLERLFHLADFHRTIRWHLERWLDSGYPYWALTRLSDPAFATDEDPVRGVMDPAPRTKRDFLERAARLDDRVPAFYARLAEQLREVPKLASTAAETYVRAIASDDVAILHRVGRGLEALGELKDSLRALRRAFERDPRCATHPEWQHRGAIASVLWRHESPLDAVAELAWIRGDTPGWRAQVMHRMSNLVKSEAEAELLRDWLDSVRPRAAAPESELADFHDALFALGGAVDARASSTSLWPVMTPIALEIDGRLLPEEHARTSDHPVLNRQVPEMRARLERTMGVRVPGVRVRALDDAREGEYAIMIDEVRVAGGVVGADRSDAHLAIVEHLDAVLRGRLVTFFGVQELSNTLDAWAGAEGADAGTRSKLVSAAVPDTPARLALLRVLQRLLRERVPIHDIGTILEVVGERRNGAVTDAWLLATGAAIRAKLAASLPGNRAGARLFALAHGLEAEIEAAIGRGNGRGGSPLPAERAKAIVDSVKRAVAAEREPVLITRREPIRPYVHELIAGAVPAAAVLSSRELVKALRDTPPTTIDVVAGART